MSRNAVPGTTTITGRPTKVWRRIAAILALLLPCTDAAHASTAATWTFEVLEVSRTNRDEALIRLRPRPPGRKFPRSCETFVVHADFDLETWSPSSRRAVTREGHERSLRLLQQAQITRDIVRFGAVGRGFGAVAESQKCEVASRGLQIVVEDDGTSAVYSVFSEPRVGPPRP
jgi:hypothetical protein